MIIVDAGGGTVDVSSYHFLSTAPITVEEVTSPECEWSLSFRDSRVVTRTDDDGAQAPSRARRG